MNHYINLFNLSKCPPDIIISLLISWILATYNNIQISRYYCHWRLDIMWKISNQLHILSVVLTLLLHHLPQTVLHIINLFSYKSNLVIALFIYAGIKISFWYLIYNRWQISDIINSFLCKQKNAYYKYNWTNRYTHKLQLYISIQVFRCNLCLEYNIVKHFWNALSIYKCICKTFFVIWISYILGNVNTDFIFLIINDFSIFRSLPQYLSISVRYCDYHITYFIGSKWHSVILKKILHRISYCFLALTTIGSYLFHRSIKWVV